MTAGLVAVMFALAWGLAWVGSGPAGTVLVEAHRSVGVVVFVVVVARLGWRLGHPLPPLPSPVSAWERVLSGAVQSCLYGGLLAMPLLGWAASDSAGDVVRVFRVLTLPSLLPMDEDRSELLFAIHGRVGIAMLALIAFHVAGALRHKLMLDDGVLERML